MKKNRYHQRTPEEVKNDQEEAKETLAGVRRMHAQTVIKVNKRYRENYVFLRDEN